MRVRALGYLSVAIAAASGSVGGAQPPVRPIGPIERVSTAELRSVSSARPLLDRRVLINDILGRQVLIFDSTLATAAVVVDSTRAASGAYTGQAGALIPYRGDSTLFVDLGTSSMLLITPSGKVDRVIAVPRGENMPYMIYPMFGTPAFDAEGRLVSRGPARPVRSPSLPDGQPGALVQPDSAPIVRASLALRTIDTAAFYAIEAFKYQRTQRADGTFSSRPRQDPIPLVDAWAVLPDGSIAVVRARDYHIDWVNPDGSRTSGPRMSFDWKHLSDEDKQRLIDSAKAAAVARLDSIALVNRQRAIASGRPPPPSAPADVLFVDPVELPDYLPPFAEGAVRADADGNLWIRTSKLVNGQPVYDIANRRGGIIDRVQLPPFRTIAGFGPGVIYMAVLDSAKGAHLERARVKR